jgi:hypothetical protein
MMSMHPQGNCTTLKFALASPLLASNGDALHLRYSSRLNIERIVVVLVTQLVAGINVFRVG